MVDPVARIPRLAMESGYDLAGFAPLQLSPEDRSNLRRFAEETLGGAMEWFGRYMEIREEPSRIMEGAGSALVLLLRYGDPSYDAILKGLSVKVSRYAVGRDYHRLLRKKGERLLEKIRSEFPDLSLQGRIAVDSAPVPEKILARMAGLGWQGKNTNLIHPRLGSYFFISVLFLNLELPTLDTLDAESFAGLSMDRCGSCRQCLDACPTGALSEYRIDPIRCLSYQTIENKKEISPELRTKLSGWILGCDICQEVCPYNRRPSHGHSPSSGGSPVAGSEVALDRDREELRARESLVDYLKDPHELEPEEWERLSPGTPLRRVGLEKWNETLGMILPSVRREGKENRP